MKQARKPSSPDAANGRSVIHNHQGQPQLQQRDVIAGIEKLGQPIEIEPPDWVRQELRHRKSPQLTIAQESAKRYRVRRFDGIALNEVQLGRSQSRVFRWFAVKGQPNEEPREADRTGSEERVGPSEPHRDEGNKQRSKNGAKVGAGVEYAGGQRALATREPLRDCLQGGGKVSGFAE